MAANLSLWTFCLILYITAVISDHAEDHVYDVVILGGGTTAVRAATVLEQHGVTNYVLIERRDATGGIVGHGQMEGSTVELGDFRVWSGDGEVFEYLDKTIDLVEYERSKNVVFDDEGADKTEDAKVAFDEYQAIKNSLSKYQEKMIEEDLPDISFRDVMERAGYPRDDMYRHYAEFWTVSVRDASRYSFKYMTGKSGTPYISIDTDGKASFLQHLTSNITDFERKVKLNRNVLMISREDDEIHVHVEGQEKYVGKYLLMATSFGELRKQVLLFDEDLPLPTWKLDAIFAYANTEMINIYLRFADSSFMPDAWRVGHVSERAFYWPLFFHVHQWLGGSQLVRAVAIREHAARLRASSDAEIKAEIVAVLRGMFGSSVPEPEHILVPRGQWDPLFYGTYSYWPVGYTKEQHAALKAPVGRIYFAGDYSAAPQKSYLAADWQAGHDVATAMLDCMKDGDTTSAECGGFVPYRGCMPADKNDYSCTLNNYAGRVRGVAWIVSLSISIVVFT